MQIGFGWGKGRRVKRSPPYTMGFALRREAYSEKLTRALKKQQRWVDACARPDDAEKLRMAKAALRPRG